MSARRCSLIRRSTVLLMRCSVSSCCRGRCRGQGRPDAVSTRCSHPGCLDLRRDLVHALVRRARAPEVPPAPRARVERRATIARGPIPGSSRWPRRSASMWHPGREPHGPRGRARTRRARATGPHPGPELSRPLRGRRRCCCRATARRTRTRVGRTRAAAQAGPARPDPPRHLSRRPPGQHPSPRPGRGRQAPLSGRHHSAGGSGDLSRASVASAGPRAPPVRHGRRTGPSSVPSVIP